jgi:DNA-binding FadR family transcriptional regulator
MVESRPRSGTRVLPRNRWNLLDPDVLGWMFETEPSEFFVRDLFELRLIVEPEAAALAATRRDGRNIARMGHALEEMDRHGLSTQAGSAADQLFHNEILQATRNEALVTLASTIESAVRWTTFFKLRRSKLVRDALPDHRKIYEAIVEGNPDAARQAMVELVQIALEDMRRALNSEGEPAR